MKYLFRGLAIACFTLLLLDSCTKYKKNEVGVVSKNFDDEIEMAQNLTFHFSQDLNNGDIDGEWDSTDYIEFEPAVKGKFRWNGKTELIFSPQSEFAPSTIYKAKFSKELFKHAENKKLWLSDKDKEFTFHTPYLALEGFEPFWAKSSNAGQIQIKTRLLFNYEVDPGAVRALLKISADNKDMPVTIEGAAPAKEIVATIEGESFGRNEVTLKVLLAKGLKISKGNYITDKPFEFIQTVPSRYDLKIVNVEVGSEDNKNFIRVITSQKILEENLNQCYSIDPEVKSEITATENGLKITGEFETEGSYMLTLNTKLKGEIGGVLKEDYSKDIFFGEPPPGISFVNKKAIYLSEKGEKNIGVQITGMPLVNLTIRKVYENNILAFVRSNRGYDYEYYEEYDEYGSGSTTYSDDYQNHYSDIIVDKQVETKNLPKVRGITALNLNLNENKAYKGVYLVKVASPDEYYLNATKIVSISDIGLIARHTNSEVIVFANSIKSAEPLSGIEVSLISSNNQNVYTVKTDGKGVAVFKDLPAKAPGFKIAMITARTTEDFNFMLFDDTRVETSRFDVDGKRGNTSGLEAFVYGDRNIYRPGETINFNTVVRDEKYSPVPNIPLKVRLIMPNGKEYRVLRKTTGTQGAADGQILLDAAVVTGTYSLEVQNGSGVLMNSIPISVEEFMPDRIKVDVSSNKTLYKPGDKAVITATAANLFGPPAGDRTYEMELNLSRKHFTSQKYRNYSFDIESSLSFDKVLRQGKTSEAGIASEAFDLGHNLKDLGIVEGKVYVTVFDETGRPVNRLQQFDIITQDALYGIAMEEYYVTTNQLMQIPLIAVNKDGNAIPADATVEVIRYEWQSVVEKYNETYRYRSRREERTILSRQVKIGSNGFNLSFAPPVSGEYEVRVRRPGSANYSSRSFYSYSYGTTASTSFEVSTEGEVLISMDKEKYNAGETAKVLFRTPFAGKLLVTVERNKVYEHYVINTDKKSASLDLKVKDEYIPNVYVSATLIRALDNSSLPLTVAHGYASLMAEKPEHRLPLDIVAAASSRSKTSQTITVKSKPESDIEVTLAVVDEGILQVKNFKSPDPYNFFFQKRGLEVNGYDMYALLFPEMPLKSSPGGDGYDLQKRINPLANKRVKLVALWSGILKTNSRGEASYKLEIPQFSGELRIMAVAYKNKGFGSASKYMKVADPLVISSALPRFFSPGDEIDLPVNITNTTNKNASVTASIKVTGALNLPGEVTRRIEIAAGREGRIQFPLKAAQMIGAGSVTIKVQGLGETFTDQTDITIRPASSLIKTSGEGVMTGGETRNVSLSGDFIQSTRKSRLIISKSPMVRFVKQFEYLLGYPHGCAEQTISKAFPQIYFADYIKLMNQGKSYLRSGENERNPAYNVQAAIRKIEGLQLYGGGINMWPGSYDHENWWVSAYAGHFFYESRKAGFEVNSQTISRLMDYLTYKTGVKTVTDHYYYENNVLRNKKMAPREMMYSLYVLAMNGRPNRATMNYYKSNMELLSTDMRYMLASAFSMIGDKSAARTILPSSYPADYSAKVTGESFYSPLRNMGLALNTLAETDINNPQVFSLSRQVSSMLVNTRYISTQEAVFAFLGLGKLARANAGSNATAVVTAGGKNLGNFTGSDLVLTNIPVDAEIKTAGSGKLYYYWENEGISATGKVVEEDKIIRVRKSFFDRNGREITNGSFKQNELIVVRVTVASSHSSKIDNVVITDIIPAGFEIENPRLTEERDFPWITKRSKPEYFDVRDDRINYYTTVYSGAVEQNYYYLVRAVSKGRYQMGPVSADAMYNGEIHSYNGAGVVVIE